ncbi:MAG: NOP58 family protein [Candidatus Micrarchaeota archaeon]|nr:NOP58 family protein [Candidatus Micrarchaeota archaeon]
MEKRSFEQIRDKMLKSAKEGIKSAYSNEEYALIQAINAYLETSKSYNLSYERLSEWYGIYFPEIRLNNPKVLADLALVMNSKDGIDKDEINKIINDEQKSESLYKKAQETIGRSMNENEKKALISFANLSNDMNRSLNELEEYIKLAANEILPNTTYLTDEKIAAEMLAKAGSMERLSSMPASTIQLLGAEKALFKHIKFGSKPPKYGVLFKMAAISNAPRDQRGRIARIYATKISIALKGDYFTKKFIAERLKEDLEKGIKRIKESPPREKKRSDDRPQRHGRPQRQGRQDGMNRGNRRPRQRY